jgi:hypothetical protein
MIRANPPIINKVRNIGPPEQKLNRLNSITKIVLFAKQLNGERA